MAEKDEVISIDEVKEKAKGEVIEIPDWTGDGTVKVRVRGVDLTKHIMQIGDLPNPLASAAAEMFEGETSQEDLENIDEGNTVERLEGLLPIMDSIVEEALVEPEYEKLEEIYPLTVAQKMRIFQHVMSGLRDMESFRTGSGEDDADGDSS